MPRRRSKQRRRQPTSDADDVEAQLRRQRIERQKCQENTLADALKPRPKTIGKFIYDPIRDTYFPKGAMMASRPTLEEEVNKYQTHPYATIPKRPKNIHAYGIASEICNPSSVRRRICNMWRGHVFLSGISTRTGFLPEGVGMNIDMYSAPNYQGFSVFTTKTHESVVWFLVSEGTSFAMRVQQSESVQDTTQCTMLTNGPPTAMKQNSCGDVAFLTDRQQSLTCIKYSIEHLYPTLIQERRNHFINDFSIHPTVADYTVMAYDKGRWCQNKFDRMAIVTSNAQSVKSDILSIEIWDVQDAVVCGHRNGQVSLGDLRSGFTRWASEPDQQFGNIASLRPLDRFSFLAKNFSGVCRLYDVRKNVPLYTMDSGSSVCKGMTTDHGNSILINAAQSEKGGCALEVWSLSTGEFINSHVVASDQPVELCSTLTQNRAKGTSLWIAQHQGKILQIDLKERYLSA